MTDLSTAPASDADSPTDHDAADVPDVEASGAPRFDSEPTTAAAVLAQLDEDGWRSLHARIASGNHAVDHLAIGPGGIFVIDDHLLDAAGAGNPPPGGSVSAAAVDVANELADAVRQLLPPLTRQYVVPVLTYVAVVPVSIARGPVQICTTSMLRRVIESRPAALSSREIEDVSAVLDAGLGEGTARPRSRSLAASEPRRAAPKRRRLGRRGGQVGQTDDSAATLGVDTAPAPLPAWPAVAPPPAWTATESLGPVVPPAPVAEPTASSDHSDLDALDALDDADTVFAEPIRTDDVPPAQEPIAPAASDDETAEADRPLAPPAGTPEGREPLVGSFPVGWTGADVAQVEYVVDDSVRLADVVDVETEPADVASTAQTPWPTVPLPDLTVAEPDLDNAFESVADEAEATGLDLAEELPAAPANAVDQWSAPTPVGRTRPGGRRRAPAAPCCCRRLTPR
jgi:hypothetical protein